MPPPDDTALARAARDYAVRGWPVLPCHPRGKVPVSAHGFHDASADLEQVRSWWSAHPAANVGLVPARCTLADGRTLLVLDLDGPQGRAAAESLGVPADTSTVTTGRPDGGGHRYFTVPAGLAVGNRLLALSLDVRHAAGYVVVPPSIHPSGAVYRWQGAPAWEPGAVLPLPAELLARLTAPDVPRRSGAAPVGQARDRFPASQGIPDARTWHRVACYLLKVPSGLSDRRKQTGFVLGAALLHDIGLDASDAWAVLRAWNSDNLPPLPGDALRQLLVNAARYAGRARTRCAS